MLFSRPPQMVHGPWGPGRGWGAKVVLWVLSGSICRKP